MLQSWNSALWGGGPFLLVLVVLSVDEGTCRVETSEEGPTPSWCWCFWQSTTKHVLKLLGETETWIQLILLDQTTTSEVDKQDWAGADRKRKETGCLQEASGMMGLLLLPPTLQPLSSSPFWQSLTGILLVKQKWGLQCPIIKQCTGGWIWSWETVMDKNTDPESWMS